MVDLGDVERFDWDTGNARKSEDKHAVRHGEVEQIFFNSPLVLAADLKQ
ncbi:MAG: hypothetical protein WD894_00230 [Pirellulales bacterium]